ncbi:GntR family transcriptional regulator [Undibacterium sp. RTI2.1]|uniref:GntR family transcriptional regulator n=1 Tax=unclassified Undibacterium TaxID=2630295 RepID=UPI002AB51A02|nr:MULTISPECIES: GntR family transcriptional regulator [unclassified Undibacterium]MDY7539469.1 GntR family transcriptional regulator [Undibacterium sp. 5I1]MEB0029613.1 GntR family transcriptional regulator [Undibacterium sp. RTI2.1]MEB0116084.1 GntR family transcriptional regulator [Undibacterium sp. RTI2.2]MEB0230728.1 GntR family transcriptional regulator [Undibacterium sp. 10I3]MEB0258793.1 GntR family transcriptional regulator [Undibacterium sp. 5I1]
MSIHSTNLFSIATGSAEPIYRQLIDQTRRLVAGGQLAPGDVLPSVREVAQALALNPMTVSKAYNMLETEGILQRNRGKGMLVAEGNKTARSATDRSNLLRPTLERAACEARQLELDSDTAMALFKKILKEIK